MKRGYWRCTGSAPHLGCTIPWIEREGQFSCPCHSSEYNRHGEVIDGPAPRQMDLMAIELDPAGNLVVNTGEISQRAFSSGPGHTDMMAKHHEVSGSCVIWI